MKIPTHQCTKKIQHQLRISGLLLRASLMKHKLAQMVWTTVAIMLFGLAAPLHAQVVDVSKAAAIDGMVAPHKLPDDVRKELEALNDAFNAAAKQRDPDAMLRLYHPDALWLPPNAARGRGQSAGLAVFGPLAKMPGSVLKHTFDAGTVSQDRNTAVMTGTFTLVVNETAAPIVGKYLMVLQRQPDGWRVVADMFSPDQ